MRIPVEICGEVFEADPAAISCVRYRMQFGTSVMGDLLNTPNNGAFLAQLAKMTWAMVAPCGMGFSAFADLCRRDPRFGDRALVLRGELLRADDRYKSSTGAETVAVEDIDEFDIVARMAATGIPDSLLYELPLLQLGAVINRVLEIKGGKGKEAKPQFYKMSLEETTDTLLGGGRRGI